MSRRVIRFSVLGIPRSKGSRRSFVSKSTGKMVSLDQNPTTKQWESLIMYFAHKAMAGGKIMDGPVVVFICASFARPKSHYRKGRNGKILRSDAPRHHTQNPDADKLLRAALDGLTGVVFENDNQVIDARIIRDWGHESRMLFEIQEIEDEKPG